MKLKEIASYLDSIVPLSFQEGFDNSGLQVGLPDSDLKAALLTLDVTDAVLDEAISEGCDLVVSHHPVIFNAVKSLTGKTTAEGLLIKAIRNGISIYSAHTNLDMLKNGVSFRMAEKLGLNNTTILSPLKNRLLKLVAYIPEDYLEPVRDAVFDAGAGVTGGYDRCGFSTPGTGSFRAGANTKPFSGEKGKLHYEKEIRFETVLFSHLKKSVIKALLSAHPYEEVAYDLYSLENDNIEAGLGCTGELRESVSEKSFLELVSTVFDARGVKYSPLSGKMIKKVALCGGSGSALLTDAISSGADAFITGDVRYHTYFDARHKILLVDCGHYETEKFSTEILYDLIIKKFPKFAVRFSKINTNPINYL